MHLSTHATVCPQKPPSCYVQQGEPANTSQCSKDQPPYLQKPCFQQEKNIQIKKGLNTTAKPRNGAALETRKYGESRAA